LKAVDPTAARTYDNLTSSYITVVYRSHLASHLDHKQKAGVSLSNKLPAGFQRHLFVHPIEEFQAMARIDSDTGASFGTANGCRPQEHGFYCPL